MLTIEVDVERLSTGELDEACEALAREREMLRRAHEPGECPELDRLFCALCRTFSRAAEERRAREEHHQVAEALGIDEETGEWRAGA